MKSTRGQLQDSTASGTLVSSFACFRLLLLTLSLLHPALCQGGWSANAARWAPVPSGFMWSWGSPAGDSMRSRYYPWPFPGWLLQPGWAPLEQISQFLSGSPLRTVPKFHGLFLPLAPLGFRVWPAVPSSETLQYLWFPSCRLHLVNGPFIYLSLNSSLYVVCYQYAADTRCGPYTTRGRGAFWCMINLWCVKPLKFGG